MVRFRQVLQGLGLVLLVVIVPVFLSLTWAREMIYDQDRYLDAVSGLAAEPAVQDALANRVANAVDDQLGNLEWPEFVEQVTSNRLVQQALLSERLSVSAYVHDRALTVIQSDAFEAAWIEVNRQAHPVVEQLLRGEDSEVIESSGGVVRLNLFPVYELLRTQLVGEGVELPRVDSVLENRLRVTVFEGDQLLEAQQTVKVLNDASWALPIVGVVLAAVLVWTAENRWRAGMAVGLAVALGGLLLWIALLVGPSVAGDRLQSQFDPAAIEVIVRHMTAILRTWALIAVGAGLVGAGACWFAERRGAQVPVGSPAMGTS